MPDIKDSVGDGGANTVHDVALVQMMLHAVKDAKNTPYFGADYTGSYSNAVKDSISKFQKDQNLLAPSGGAGSAAAEKDGLIAKSSQTLAKLNTMLPTKYATARIIENTKTVYLEMDAAAASASATAINAKTDLDAAFRANVANLVSQVYRDMKIALTVVVRSGWNRSFSQQAALDPATTNAGPGESNHNWGKAVDIGFNHLKWVRGDGDVFEDNWWLEGKDASKKVVMSEAKANAFWAARNRVAAGLNLFPTTFAGDTIHLQAYDDARVSMANSLAALLNQVTVKNMKWLAVRGHPNQYKNDFGLGGAKFGVGTSKQIWAGTAPVTKADLAAALNAKLAADKKFNVYTFFGVTPVPPGPPPAPPIKEADIKGTYLAKIKSNLQADFQAAEANVAKWKPLP